MFLSKILTHSCLIIHYIKAENIFGCYCLQAFRTTDTLNCHIKDCFKINGKQGIKMPEKGEYVRFKNYETEIKSPFMIYADFESILVPEDNG